MILYKFNSKFRSITWKSGDHMFYGGKGTQRFAHRIKMFSINKSKNLIYSDNIEDLNSFWNQTFDKGRLKIFVLWFLKKYGEHKTIKLVEELKNIGFQYATKAGVSLGIEDLKIPTKKYSLIMEAEQLSFATIKQYKRGEITGVERFQRLIDTWHRTSERLKQEVIDNFESTDILNPVYMMAFSGARGNISQVRQLVGMRGLMSDPQGQIIDFPIRSNFREGLTLTEYIISSYGARKGIVDTALRTANAGYLTRRLVDVAQHVIISSFDCGTKRGIFLTDMKEGNKTIYSLQNRLIGRVLARDIFNSQKLKIASRNTEISADLATSIALLNKKVFVRSTLTCQTKKLVCQLCYGWSLAQGNLVSIGEAVGVVAAQSIGEPGTQLTMRTFHTGGVFSGDVSDQIRAPFNGFVEYKNPIAGTLIRTPEGKIAFLTKNEGSFMVHNNDYTETKKFKIPFYTLLFLRNGSPTEEKEVIAQISSINRQKNATDQAELTIKAELSGQFYSKMIDLKENKVGPKLKNSNDKDRIIEDQFNENAVDTIFEAWGWGYTWVLSGKIYQLGLPSNIFPIFGDYVHKKTYMNKINWILPSSFGSSFNLNAPIKKEIFNKTEIKKLNIKKFESNALEKIKSTTDIFLKNELVSFNLSKITYKKRGYFLKLSEPISSFSIRSHDFNSYFKNTEKVINKSTSILSSQDSLFLLSSIKNRKVNKNIYPANWEQSFDIFLNWFPKSLSTTTAGLIFVDPLSKIKKNQSSDKFFIKSSKNSLKPILFKSGSLTSVEKNYKFYGIANEQYNIKRVNSNQNRKFDLCSLNTIKRQEYLTKKNLINLSSNYSLNSHNIVLKDLGTQFKSNTQFFPTFLHRRYLNRFQIVKTTAPKDNLRLKTNLSIENQLPKSLYFIEFKSKQISLNSNFSNIKDTAQLLKKLYRKNNKFIREQYTQKQFDTILHTGLNFNKNKTKTEIFTFGLNWKNAYKLNTNFITTQPVNNKNNLNKLATSAFQLNQKEQKVKWNQTTNFQSSDKVIKTGTLAPRTFNPYKDPQTLTLFWVPQPFYGLSMKNAKKIYFPISSFSKKTNLNFIENKIRNRFYSSKNEETLFQMNRQGKFKVLNLSEGYIETNKNPYYQEPSVFFSQKEKGVSQFVEILSKASTTTKDLNLLISSLFYVSFKKEGLYTFNSFDSTLLNRLKNRKIIINDFLPCSELKIIKTKNSTLKKFNQIRGIQKSLQLKEEKANKENLSFLTLKTFSKISSVPYFLTGSFLNKKIKNSLKKPDLFTIYFYTLLNKKIKFHKIFNNDIFMESISFNIFKDISSPYLNNTLKFSILNLNGLPRLNPTTISSPEFNLAYKQLYIGYSLDNYYFGVKEDKTYLDYSVIKLQSEKTCSERIESLTFWLNKANLNKKFYLKTIFKINKKLYFSSFKGDFIQNKIFKAKLLKGFITRSNSYKRKKSKVLTSTQKSALPKIKNNNNKILLNIIIKKGWIYYSPNIENLLSFHKKLIKPGKTIANDFIFDTQSIFLEIIQFDNLFNFNQESIVTGLNFSFTQTVRNHKTRFYSGNDSGISHFNSCFLLIRKANEYKLEKDFEYKKEIKKLSNDKNQGPSLFNFQEIFSSKVLNSNQKLDPTINLINQSFNSIDLLFSYSHGELNKKKITSQTLSKYPSPDFKIISNSSMYLSMDFIKKSFQNNSQKLSEFETPITSLKPVNFSPFVISYRAPYSLDFPFKTPLRLFSSNDFLMDFSVNQIEKKKSLSTSRYEFKNSSNNYQSHLKNLLASYLIKIKNKSSELNNLHLIENIEAQKIGNVVGILSSFLNSPIAEYSLGKNFEKSISFPNQLFISNHSKWRDLIFNLNSVNNKHYLSNLNGPVLGSLNKSFESKSDFISKEGALYKTKFVSFFNHKVTTQLPFIKTYTFSSFEGELIFKNSTSIEKNKRLSELFGENSIRHGCVILTKKDQISYYFPTLNKNQQITNYKNNYSSLEKEKNKNNYQINDMVIHFLNIAVAQSTDVENSSITHQTDESKAVKLTNLPAGMSQQRSKLLIGDFLVYGDQISPNIAISKPGQIIHINNQKITLRQGQPIFVSPKSILHKYDGDFIDQQSPVITLSYQQLKTGDIIQGIPKVEQFFEARTTKRGRLFRDSLSNLLKGLFKRYRSKLPLDQAVRQSFYKIQQIIVDGVQRVYRSQGVSIADKHLEVIVKQMTCKVRIIEGGQTGFFPGEIVDLDFVEQVNNLLMKKIVYEPLVLGITKSSLEVDSFLSAASFQQTTRVLSKAAISRKKDFLKGLKENVILGNLIPAGTGYLVYLDPL